MKHNKKQTSAVPAGDLWDAISEEFWENECLPASHLKF
jgi:hypothetical protein